MPPDRANGPTTSENEALGSVAMSDGVPNDRPRAGRTTHMLQDGAELVGALTGAAVGLVGGPEGAMFGAAAGVVATKALGRLGTEIIDRVGDVEAIRVGAAATVIAADVDALTRDGRRPRDDGFFEPRGTRRPAADDLLEGVLRQAGATYEENKVPLLAHLYAGVAYSDLAPADAQYLLRLADQVTYRQLVVLAVFARDQHVVELTRATVGRDEGRTRPSSGVALEIDNLADRGVIGVQVAGGDQVARPSELWGSVGPASNHSFVDLKLLPAGERLNDLMQLATIPDDDSRAVLEELQSGN